MSVTQETTTTPSVERLTGQVKWFNTKAGYGFITVCDGEHAGKDIFVHFSSLSVVNSQYRYLVQGEYVEFSLLKSDSEKYEYHAVEVSGIKGGVIMCETRNVNPERPQGQQVERRQTRRPVRKPQAAKAVEGTATGVLPSDVPVEVEFQRVTKKKVPQTPRPKPSA
jgi:CspA family cold shock protein